MKFFNNLTRELEDFKEIKPGQVFIYSCGPTVYDISHIGHARSCISWDLLYRYLKYRNYQVKWIRNITNVDDKIVKRSQELNCSSDTLSRVFTYEFWKDLESLNISWPDFEPRATDYLSQMYEFIQGLIDKGFAYESEGDVYFRVENCQSYGALKGQSIEDFKEGMSRVEENSRKESQLDFALWKAFPDEPDTSFASPWSMGRPGWHLECSTMIKSILNQAGHGDTLDIHTGGDDLIHPHHVNECAQSESLTGKPLAKYWLHNGMVMINGAKMSKSENNFFTIRDLLQKYKPNTIRYFCLATHYKKQINFSHEALEAAETGLNKLFASLEEEMSNLQYKPGLPQEIDFDQAKLDQELIADFCVHMDNDLASPQALALLFENKHKPYTVLHLLYVLGFDLQARTQASSLQHEQVLDFAIAKLLELREKARATKDFATSDNIRDSLSQQGLIIKDHRDKPSEWSFKHV